MSDISDFRDAINAWIVSQTEWPAWWAFQNTPSTPPNFISMQILSINDIGLPYLDVLDDEGNRNIIFDRKLSLSISFFGIGAIDLADAIRNSLFTRAVIDIFTAAGLTFLQCNSLLDNTRVLEKSYQHQATLDLLFYYRAILSENVGIIESVDAEGSYYFGDTLIYQDEIYVERGD